MFMVNSKLFKFYYFLYIQDYDYVYYFHDEPTIPYKIWVSAPVVPKTHSPVPKQCNIDAQLEIK